MTDRTPSPASSPVVPSAPLVIPTAPSVIPSGARNLASPTAATEMPRVLGMTGLADDDGSPAPHVGGGQAMAWPSHDGAVPPEPSPTPSLPLDPPPACIAVFRALFLGDLLCATPALRTLRRHFPAAEITLIGLPWARDLVARLPYLDRFEEFPGHPGIAEVPYDPERAEPALARLRAAGYDLAVQMHGDGRTSNGFVAALGARATLGYRIGADDRLSLALPWVDDEHEALRWLRLVACLGAPTDDTRLDFPTTPAEDRRATDLLAVAHGNGPLVALHAGAKDAARRWPPECFALLADHLVERWGARIVLTGAAGERDLTAAVRSAMGAPALDLAGATDLGPFAALIARLDLLVTNDTGASHLAAATGTPSVVLFGLSRPARWAPLDRTCHRAVDAADITGIDPRHALAALPVASVLAACDEALRACQDRVGGRSPVVSPQYWEAEGAKRGAKEPLCAG